MILPLHSKPEEEFDVTRGIVPAGSLTFKMEMKMNEMRLCSYRIAPDIFRGSEHIREGINLLILFYGCQ